MILLYGSQTSPFVRHCRIAMLEQEMPFELVETDYARSAELSPAMRVPFFTDGPLLLTDSLAILHEVRMRARRSVFTDSRQVDFFCLSDTVLDAGINLFLLARDGLGPDQSPYLSRQAQRVEKGFKALEERLDSQCWEGDASWRLACLLGWFSFRKRFDFSSLPALSAFHRTMESHPLMVASQPR